MKRFLVQRLRRGSLAAAASLALVVPMQAQGPFTVKVFHPTETMPSYEVATIKKADPDSGRIPGQFAVRIKDYILNAYGLSSLSQGQVVGGPAWTGTDMYVIQPKVSDELRDAMQKMTPEERRNQNCMLRLSLLADRFKLKSHIETRDLPIYELTVAKDGPKFKEVPAPPPFVPGGPPPAPRKPNDPLRPGGLSMQSRDGVTTLTIRASTVSLLVNMLRASADVGGRPIVDKTGFAGHFDVDLKWAYLTTAQGTEATRGVDMPSLFTALEEQLGLKLVATKGPVEVVVIDSIDRPSEN